jgi:hypothetical protein
MPAVTARHPLLAAACVAAGLVLAAPAAGASKVRVAIPDFEVAGSSSPALALQLQDGFVLGLVRAGVQVVDPVDTARGLDSKPELGRCDSSPCLKSIGQILDVKYLVRVKIDVAGNSYKVVGRIFSTEGPAPAALPVANKSKSCDVCTVAEARDVMFRLADALKVHLEEPAPPPSPPLPPAPPPPPPSLQGPLAATLLGSAAIIIGVSVLAATSSCTTRCDDNRFRGALGGALVGAGAVVTVGGAYLTVERTHTPQAPRTAVTVALRF